MRPSSCEPHRILRRDDGAVSEVIGYITTFAIVSTLVLLALLAFNESQGRAEERVVEERAASAAQRVAKTVVEVGLQAESNPTASVTLPVGLPPDFEGHGYSIRLTSTEVTVEVTGLGVIETEAIFGALQSAPICPDAAAAGGRVEVGYDATSDCFFLRN